MCVESYHILFSDWLKQILIFVIKCRGKIPQSYFALKLMLDAIESRVWTYFDILEDNNTKAMCKVCQEKGSRIKWRKKTMQTV